MAGWTPGSLGYALSMPTSSLLLSAALMFASGLSVAQAPVDTASHNPMGDEAGHTEKPATPATVLEISVGGHPALTLHLADLQAMPQTTVQVFNGHNKQNETYSGPLVATVLAKAGVTLAEKTQHDILDSYLVATGTDGYFVVYSGAELQPGLHKTQAIIAVAQAGHPLNRTGAFQLIDPEDAKPARWVRNVKSLTVVPVTGSAR